MTSTTDLQYAIGTNVDGVWGPKSRDALWAGIHNQSGSVFAALAAYITQQHNSPALTSLGIALADHLDLFEITANAKRLANFLGQGAHETMGFTRYRELWGPTKAQIGYEGRADLGNTHPGDGKRYMGRGIFQTTGRANYQRVSERIGVDFVSNPVLLETPDMAVLSACIYWQDRKLGALADAGKYDLITKRINGGTNGIEERRAAVARAERVLA